MDWSKIKSIFIVSFLVLNIFLAYQLMNKISGGDLEIVSESFEEDLAANNITYGQLPKTTQKESFIGGERHTFTKSELNRINDDPKQSAELEQNNKVLYSILTTPLVFKNEIMAQRLQEFVTKHVWKGQHYKYWGIDYEKKEIYFFQNHYDKVIYRNQNAMITFYFDEQQQILSYKQTYIEGLSNIVPKEERQELIAPLKAIQGLYDRNMLPADSKITKIDLGYYSLVLEPEGAQVFVPTWYIQVNGENNYFVNAVEGQVIQEETQWSEKN